MTFTILVFLFLQEEPEEGASDYEEPDIKWNPDDPMEENLLPLDDKKERRLLELQSKPRSDLTKKEAYDMNELYSEKICNTRFIRFKDSRQEEQEKVNLLADKMMTAEKLNVPLVNKLSDGQLKLILRTHTLEDKVQLQHPFGLVTSSSTNIDAYYKRYNISEEKYPKHRK